MNLKDFADLAAAHAHTEVSSRMVSPDMMLAFLATFNLMSVIMGSNSNEALALRKALDFGSDFNFITGHPASVTPLLDRMIAEGTIPQSFKEHCVSYANKLTNPFIAATQSDYDKQVSKANPTTDVETTYVSQDFLVKGRRETIHQVDITIDPLDWDDVITVTAQSMNHEDNSYVQSSQPAGSLQVPANFSGTLQLTLNKSALKNKCKYFLSSKFNRTLSGYAYNNG